MQLLDTVLERALVPAAPLLAALIPAMAFAQTDTVMGDTLCQMASWATGNTGKGLACVGVSIIGIKSVQGKISWPIAFLGGVGIACIFGAAKLVQLANPAIDPTTCVATIDPSTGLPVPPTRSPVRTPTRLPWATTP